MERYWVRNTYWVDDQHLEEGNSADRVLMYLAADVDAALAELKAAQLKCYYSMLDDVMMLLASFHYSTPERGYKNDGGWSLALSDLNRALTAATARAARAEQQRDRLAAILSELVQAVENERQWATGTPEWEEARYQPYAIAEQAEAALREREEA